MAAEPEKTVQPKRVFPYAIPGLLGAFPLTFLFINLVGSYWKYWDMGSSGGNGFALLFLYSPRMLVIFLVIAILMPFLLSRILARWQLTVVSIGSLLLVFVAAFLIEVWRVLDYPGVRTGSMGGFLFQYMRKWLFLFR